MTLKEALGLLFIGCVLFLFLSWATSALCWDCGGTCVNDLDCPSACACMFPENDDNHHYGRCI